MERGEGRCRVVVVAGGLLVAQTVEFALASRGHDVVAARVLPEPSSRSRWLARQVTARDAEIGLLLVDLDAADQRGAAAQLVAASDIDWIVLSDTEADAARGTAVHAGAIGVLPMSIRLEDIDLLLRRLHTGQPCPLLSDADRERWLAARNREERLHHTSRLEGLTPREREVLDALSRGSTVDQIGTELGVGTSTVRSHVRAILRKLHVHSQLAAVVAYRQRWEEGVPG